MADYLQLAAARWPKAKAIGSGRWALLDRTDPATVFLFDSEPDARAAGLFYDRPALYDLKPPRANYCWEDPDDKEWERKQGLR
jgi:hypothetical protein